MLSGLWHSNSCRFLFVETHYVQLLILNRVWMKSITIVVISFKVDEVWSLLKFSFGVCANTYETSNKFVKLKNDEQQIWDCAIDLDYGCYSKTRFKMHQIDVKTVLLNGELENNIHMEQLDCFMHIDREHLVCKLHKLIFDMKLSFK